MRRRASLTILAETGCRNARRRGRGCGRRVASEQTGRLRIELEEPAAQADRRIERDAARGLRAASGSSSCRTASSFQHLAGADSHTASERWADARDSPPRASGSARCAAACGIPPSRPPSRARPSAVPAGYSRRSIPLQQAQIDLGRDAALGGRQRHDVAQYRSLAAMRVDGSCCGIPKLRRIIPAVKVIMSIY